MASRESARDPAGALPIPPLEPSTPFAARVASGIFAGQALLLLGIACLPAADGLSPLRFAIPAACAAGAVALRLAADRVTPLVLNAAAALCTLLLTANLLLSADGPTLSDELLYIWPALYSAYFFSVRQAAFQLALISAGYLGALVATVEPESVIGSWITLVAVIFPAAALLRAVRDGVTQLVRRHAEAARTDTLTGLKNRLALDQEIEVALERALRDGSEVGIIVGDIDHFKKVNDRLGHRAGDEALQRAGQILAAQRRVGDSIARTGGEEFTVLLPGASQHETYLVAERMRAAVARAFRDDPVEITFSFGVAAYPEHGRSADAVVEAADQALYAAKALGRNRAVIFNQGIETIFAPEPSGRGVDESHLATLLSLAEALDLRDTGTAAHSRTVGRLSRLIAEQLELPPERVRRVEVAGVLHDIGKVGVPDAVLQKPGPLGRREQQEVRTHPEVGAHVLSGRGLEDLRNWILTHHERPDGKGYPAGLSDTDIPLEAKILAVADAYEAMTVGRVYRAGIGPEAARSELLRCSGTQFDARVVAACLAVLDRLERERTAPVGT